MGEERLSNCPKLEQPWTPRTVIISENVGRVDEALLRNPKLSARRHSESLGMSDRCVPKLTHLSNLTFGVKFPPIYYNAASTRVTSCGVFSQRAGFYHTLLEMINEQPALLENLIVSDEAQFNLDESS